MSTASNLLLGVAAMAMMSFVASSASAEVASRGAGLLGLFPDSKSPTFYGKKSELVVQRHLRHWARNSNWHPELDERSVFHARLVHKSVEERSCSCSKSGPGGPASCAGGSRKIY